MTDDDSQIVVPKSDYILEQIDGEILLYHPDQTKIIYCNQTASLIWQLADGQRTIGEIIELLQAAYPEAGQTIAHDVRHTIAQLHNHNAIRLVSTNDA